MTIATGGVVTTATIGGVTYTVHTFAADGTFTVTTGGADIEYLMVAGGASGGVTTSTNRGPGGGGAGGVLHNIGAPISLAAGSFPVVIGVGGASRSGATTARGANGTSSTFNGLSAVGGGAGGVGGGAPRGDLVLGQRLVGVRERAVEVLPVHRIGRHSVSPVGGALAPVADLTAIFFFFGVTMP